jgi:hypothetical protein
MNNPRLLELCQAWGYSQNDIAHIRNPKRWLFSELLEENRLINGALQSGLTLVQALRAALIHRVTPAQRPRALIGWRGRLIYWQVGRQIPSSRSIRR